jgi:hypothetical protein
MGIRPEGSHGPTGALPSNNRQIRIQWFSCPERDVFCVFFTLLGIIRFDQLLGYPIIRRLIRKHRAGLHVKTAGTTWLEELIGLAESGGEGLMIAKEIYAGAMQQFAELTKPYASVIEIDPERLPSADAVASWNSGQFVASLNHDPECADFNPHFRQLLHVSFKLAAKMGTRYTNALEANRSNIERRVTENLFKRHIQPIFG